MTKFLDGMAFRFGVIILLVTAMPCWLAAQDQSPDVQLKGKTKKALNEVLIPAMAADNQIAFLNTFVPMINGTKPDTLEAIEKYCRHECGQSVRQYFVDLIIGYAQQGVTPDQVIKNPTIARYIVAGLISRVGEIKQSAEQHPCMDATLKVPKDWNTSEKLFWSMHVLRNELDNAARLLEFGSNIIEINKSKLRRSDEGKKLADHLADSQERFENTRESLEERFAELRLQRFESAVDTLKKQGDFESMLIAATNLEIDGESLLSYLGQERETPFKSAQLNQVGLIDTIKDKLAKGRKLAGHVGVKAGLLRNGLHYWLRGRYGEGPLASGLLKHPNATSSKFHMEALWMPKERPNAIQSYYRGEEESPGYERRHYYTWKLESRDPGKLGLRLAKRTETQFL